LSHCRLKCSGRPLMVRGTVRPDRESADSGDGQRSAVLADLGAVRFLGRRCRRLLEDLRRTAGLTVVVISHDFSGLEDLCPRTLNLHDGELAATPTAAGGMS